MGWGVDPQIEHSLPGATIANKGTELMANPAVFRKFHPAARLSHCWGES